MNDILGAKNKFIGDVKTSWEETNGRDMKLLQSVVYIDAHHRVWKAPKDSIIDGASIPRFFWRIIGSPFVGRYRRASVVHDVYCKTRSRPYKMVHKMFYEAMLCDGVPKMKAYVMYLAVRFGGPKW